MEPCTREGPGLETCRNILNNRRYYQMITQIGLGGLKIWKELNAQLYPGKALTKKKFFDHRCLREDLHRDFFVLHLSLWSLSQQSQWIDLRRLK